MIKHEQIMQHLNFTPMQGHGMEQRLDMEDLFRAPPDGVARLAAWLGVSPKGPWATPQDEAKALRAAVLGAERRLADGPRELRWVQKLTPPGTKAAWPAPPPAGAMVKSSA